MRHRRCLYWRQWLTDGRDDNAALGLFFGVHAVMIGAAPRHIGGTHRPVSRKPPRAGPTAIGFHPQYGDAHGLNALSEKSTRSTAAERQVDYMLTNDRMNRTRVSNTLRSIDQ